MMRNLHVIHLNSVPIFRQLQLEEALLRTDERNFCIINTNCPKAIVMGISGNADKLLDVSLIAQDKIPVIRRFSGGGTVVIDEGTLFISFICNPADFSFPAYPQAILQWSEQFYFPLFPEKFHLRENDYVIGMRKVGGNAQYIKKQKWLLHTSFLWDFSQKNMDYLLLPEKRPSYRQDRTHVDFLTQLSSYFSCKNRWITQFKEHLKGSFNIKESLNDEIDEVLNRPHRMATTYMESL